MRDAGVFFLNFHGVIVRVECADADIAARVSDDFPQFHSDAPAGAPAIELALIREEPCYDELPAIRASIHTPRNVCYDAGDLTYIDYFGKALAIYRRSRQRIEVRTTRPHLLHEIAYLTLLSRVSEQLERRGLHRVHALAVSKQGRTAIVLLPSTGGKTTLALHFLRGGDGWRLVSEDSPLVDRHGRIHPMPLRLGVVSEEPPPFPPEFVTFFERMEFGPKYLVSLRAFPGAIETETTEPAWLFIGRRSLGKACRIVPVSRRAGFRALTSDMIVGLGLYQGLEFLLRRSALDLLAHTKLIAGRTRAATALLRRSRVYEIELGRDLDLNATTLSAFLRDAIAAGGSSR